MYIASQISIWYANVPRNATVLRSGMIIRAVDGLRRLRSGSDSNRRRPRRSPRRAGETKRFRTLRGYRMMDKLDERGW